MPSFCRAKAAESPLMPPPMIAILVFVTNSHDTVESGSSRRESGASVRPPWDGIDTPCGLLADSARNVRVPPASGG